MVYTFNPLEDSRWGEFVRSHPAGSIFHTSGWLEALRRTYDYEPVVYTTSPPAARLTSAIPLCRIQSWLTGRRLVSLPFADHCEPLVEGAHDRADLVAALRKTADDEHLKYVELRPRAATPWDEPGLARGNSFRCHTLDLRPDLERLRTSVHNDSINRRIRRAEREALTYEEGTSEGLLDAFNRMMLLTRRRHGVPPQPVLWFRNLIACLGGQIKIRVASHNGRPIAGMLTLQHADTLVYKYGCSDARFHNLGAVPFLFWKAIQDAKAQGLTSLDLGRSDLSNVGLIAFKERWGAAATTLTYVRCFAGRPPESVRSRLMRMPDTLLARMPDRALVMAGRLLYRHLG